MGALDSRKAWRLRNCLLACVTLFCVIVAQFACREAGENTVVANLKGADQQWETVESAREIERALNDMLTLSPDELRRRRYANYQMDPGAWTIIELLHRYFVPLKPLYVDKDRFYRDVTAVEARAVIRAQLEEVRRSIVVREAPDQSNTDAEEKEKQ